MILDWIRSLGPWTWVIVGIVLLGLEILAPGNVFVWMGLAALVVGALALGLDVAWQFELLIFAVLGRRWFARRGGASEEPLLNERATRLIGNVHVLTAPIVDGRGTLRIADTNWMIAGPDLPSGTRVKITGHDGSVLSVERVG